MASKSARFKDLPPDDRDFIIPRDADGRACRFSPLGRGPNTNKDGGVLSYLPSDPKQLQLEKEKGKSNWGKPHQQGADKQSNAIPFYDLPDMNSGRAPTMGTDLRDPIHFPDDQPGPGAYDPKNLDHQQALPNYSDKRFPDHSKNANDTTYLDPFDAAEKRKAEKGKSDWGKPHQEKAPDAANPIPFYDLPDMNSGRAPTMGTDLRDPIHFPDDQPGPGAYDAVDDKGRCKSALPKTTYDRAGDVRKANDVDVDVRDVMGTRTYAINASERDNGMGGGAMMHDVDYMPLRGDVEKAGATHAAFRDTSARAPEVIEGDEGADFVTLDGIGSGLGNNPVPSFSSKQERFKPVKGTDGPVTYLDDLIKPPKTMENPSWMFKGGTPTQGKLPQASNTIPFYDLPSQSSGGCKFGTAPRFDETPLDDLPGPGDYSERPKNVPPGVPSLDTKATRFEANKDDTPGPDYNVPGLAEVLTARSSRSNKDIAFDSTTLRFPEE
eukprot:TRINITY_DN3816_c0_g1_i3.p1 TRINITY_DN3816_c0_g1~~TRINITY_DN3816_c0_g1_i3.p1  ORF type:complete len:557 (+),score=110.94 TRINITY_DN3816_c0_g1_i3:190-1671(+)